MVTLDFGFFTGPRVRLVRQTEVTECGIASIVMIAAYHGLNLDLGSVRRQFAPSLRGSSIRSLMSVADEIGLVPRAVNLPLEELQNLHLPCILHWDLDHYVVLEKVKLGSKNSWALIHDPEGRSIKMPIEEVSKHFTGVALELRRGEDFESGDRAARLRLSQLWQRTSGLKRALIQILVLTFVLQAYILALPYYMQLAIDKALPALDLDLLAVLAIGFALFTLLNAGAALLRSFVVLVTGTTLGFAITTNIARRLFRLPIDWFERRHTGDILSRFQSVMPIQNMLSQGAVAALVDGVLAIATLAIMFWYSALLSSLAILAFTLYAIVRLVSYAFEREAQEASIVTRGKEQTNLIETLRGMTVMRLFGFETLRHALWQTRLADATNANIRVTRIGIWQGTANSLVFGLENILTIYFAINFVIEGSGFSIGMVFAFMAYKGQFIQKGTTLIDTAIAFRMLGLHLERLSDIALADEDVSFGKSFNHHTDLKGQIVLRDVHFRYSPSDPLILTGTNLMISEGEFIAITGPSGGGKSTLIKLMLGLIEAEKGEMLVDGLPLERFGHKSYHRQIASVLQEDTLFEGTLLSNIALFEENPDKEKVVRVAQAASIHEDILDMPMQYQTRVGDMGSNLSGGQKQRVLLARALYRQPKVLIMDEGTAHLDVDHERAVNEALKELGITRIIVAHRRETVHAADRVLVMKGGKLQ